MVVSIIIFICAAGLGTYWVIRASEHNHIVNKGAGVISQPNVTCRQSTQSGPICTRNVKLYIDATGQTSSQDDVNGLYAQAEAAPGQSFTVQAVYVDETNSTVDKVVFGGTAYQIETTHKAFGEVAAIAWVIAVGAAIYLLYCVNLRRKLMN
jgi:hypothetical protein